MNTLRHFRFVIADCQLISDCRLPMKSQNVIGNWQSEIGMFLTISEALGIRSPAPSAVYSADRAMPLCRQTQSQRLPIPSRKQ
jgi:hypothetical protein